MQEKIHEEMLEVKEMMKEAQENLSCYLNMITDHAQKQAMLEVRVSHLESEVSQIKQHMAI